MCSLPVGFCRTGYDNITTPQRYLHYPEPKIWYCVPEAYGEHTNPPETTEMVRLFTLSSAEKLGKPWPAESVDSAQLLMAPVSFGQGSNATVVMSSMTDAAGSLGLTWHPDAVFNGLENAHTALNQFARSHGYGVVINSRILSTGSVRV